MVTQLMNHALMAPALPTGKSTRPTRRFRQAEANVERKALPSYVSGRSFASALLGPIVVPNADGTTALTELRNS